MRRNPAYRIDEQAAEWLVHLENREQPLSPAQQTAFFKWLARSPEHLRAYLDIADLRGCLEAFDRERRIDISRLLRPRPREVSSHPRRAVAAPVSASRRPLALAAGIALLACAALAVFVLHSAQSAHLRTAVGEQRSFRLPDGSIVQLNTRSRVALDFSGTARRVRLLDGEALFSVEHDASRPFYVLTDTTTIRAVGTQFNVYRHADSGETTVSVVDGVVQVSPAAMKESTRVAAGESAQIERGGKLVHHEHTPIADAVAWRERRLVFQDASLSEVAAEFNRYNTVQIRTVGTVGETRHIAGIFSADHPQSLILHLKRDPMLEVSEVDGSFIVSAR